MRNNMRTGIDWHALGGILGTATAVLLQNFNAIAAGVAASSTAIYMLLRVAREWRAMKREDEKGDGPLCKNFAPGNSTKSANEKND
jgi:hypothetical protein